MWAAGNKSVTVNLFVKVALLETNPYLLGLTIVVSIVHSIFEFLAFKNGKVTAALLEGSSLLPSQVTFRFRSSQISSSGTAVSLWKASLCAPSFLEFSSHWLCCSTYLTTRPTLWCRSASSSGF